jgi:hypothetical protein
VEKRDTGFNRYHKAGGKVLKKFTLLIFCFALSLHADKVKERFAELFISHLLHRDHPLRGWLDVVFSNSEILDSEETLRAAGFEILFLKPHHPAIMRHPNAVGYIFKVYLNSENQYPREGISGVEWLLRRCVGAEDLRRWIEKRGIRHFVVPEKWLYPLLHQERHPVILVATDMQIENKEMNLYAWKTLISHQHLRELAAILKAGFGSIYVSGNILYTKNATFAFVDTEKPKQTRDLNKITSYLSETMQVYWEQLIR